jgi:hypothetical protein
VLVILLILLSFSRPTRISLLRNLLFIWVYSFSRIHISAFILDVIFYLPVGWLLLLGTNWNLGSIFRLFGWALYLVLRLWVNFISTSVRSTSATASTFIIRDILRGFRLRLFWSVNDLSSLFRPI